MHETGQRREKKTLEMEKEGGERMHDAWGGGRRRPAGAMCSMHGRVHQLASN